MAACIHPTTNHVKHAIPAASNARSTHRNAASIWQLRRIIFLFTR
jgi:hypothetical protein